MPTKTTYYGDDLYAYIVETMDDNFSERVQELCEKGRQAEVQEE